MSLNRLYGSLTMTVGDLVPQLLQYALYPSLERLPNAIVGSIAEPSPWSVVPETWSTVNEMLARLGVGRLVLVDPDQVESENLNRIP